MVSLKPSKIARAVSRSEVYVTEMAPAGMSLEQYFLHVTGSS